MFIPEPDPTFLATRILDPKEIKKRKKTNLFLPLNFRAQPVAHRAQFTLCKTKRTYIFQIESQPGILDGGLFAAQFTLCKTRRTYIFRIKCRPTVLRIRDVYPGTGSYFSCNPDPGSKRNKKRKKTNIFPAFKLPGSACCSPSTVYPLQTTRRIYIFLKSKCWPTVLRMWDVYPGSWFSSISDPGSSKNKKEERKFCTVFVAKN